MAGIEDIGRFSEGGRGVPVSLSRPQGALPYSPLVKQAYVVHPKAILGWGHGIIAVEDVALEPPIAVLSRDDTLRTAARLMLRDDVGFVPVCDDRHFVGVVFAHSLLECVADERTLPNVAKVISTQIPTCAPYSALVDAVRQMIACYLRRIPVVGDAGELIGLLTLAEACAASMRDPAVAEVIERFAASPSLFARPLR